MENIDKKQLFKFLVLSLSGIFIFFIPVSDGNIPITWAVNFIKSLFGDYVIYIPVLSSLTLFLSTVLGKCFHISPFKEYMENDGPFKSVIFVCSFLIVFCIMFKIGPQPLQNPAVGGQVLKVASNVMITIALAGWAVVLILKSGIVEFIAVLVEPIMRPVFKLPGEAAVNCLSSFVSSASVGVYFTEQYYKNNKYSEAEALSVLMNFSVISVGYMGVLVTTANIENMFGTVLITAFILVLVMAAICIRIPPLSMKKKVYYDGHVQTAEETKVEKMGLKNRFMLALNTGVEKSKEFTSGEVIGSLKNALKFSQKIIGIMITCVVIVLTIVNYTDVFTYLGRPLIPLLQLFHIENASQVASAVMLGFVEVSLPSISISAANVAVESAFFVVMMSILQIIFMTEAGNAMLSSDLPVDFKDLVLMFIIRTLVAIPLIALAIWIVF